ncbi:ABC transporter ATP-binding protein [Citricoccus sp. K5]|uniref:ABC transporter ATP-binding protein n=1 Tax=Citricoccus sp. K5 TaxID=2653135 RepID=UPI0012F3B8BC|nr:ABC transporter ATP-binding protein [Citricoccus sp. K5]VXB80273.1 Duplicated ATPase component YkoD of energizing module of thiamin-regulated ECF transporter for HydroxyMethylPyrimidine [Citricoccus sp. K5]
MPGARITAAGWGWRHAGRPVPAVADLDLEVPAGQKVLLAGPSGAGKSTLLYALAGVLDPADESEETGSLRVDGTVSRQLRGHAGLVQQDPETQVILSRVGDDAAFGAENLQVPRDQIWDRVRDALDAVGLGEDQGISLARDTSRLSGGQKQRLALAGILAMRPPLILLDEPTANLDPAGVLEVRDAVLAVVERTGATLLVVEHRLAIWADHVDRMLVLEPGGGISHDGSPGELLAPGRVRDELAAAGVWVPGRVPTVTETRPTPAPPGALLTARGLAVSKEPVTPGWRRRFGPTPTPVQADLDLELGAGEAVVVTGANGSGKSTLLLTLAGLIPSHAGTLTAGAALKGERAGHLPDDPHRWKAADLVSRIGTVFQEPEHQFVATTVREELLFGPRHARDPESGRRLFTDVEAAQRADGLLAALNLESLAEVNPFTLSGGEKRRLSVATVLAAGPEVVFLDEPTFGQDANTWAVLTGLLRGLVAEGRSVLAVTHDADFAAALDARTIELEVAA